MTFPFTGFFDPVNNKPVLNVAHAGDAIPVRFSLGGDRGLGIVGKVTTSKAQAKCKGVEDAIEETIPAEQPGDLLRPVHRPLHLHVPDQRELGRHVPQVHPEAERRLEARRELQVHPVTRAGRGSSSEPRPGGTSQDTLIEPLTCGLELNR